MVRLVFRPYSHVGRTICTSVSLQASTRVSPGFTMRTNRSPSFGSHRGRSDSSLPRGEGRSTVRPPPEGGGFPSRDRGGPGFAFVTRRPGVLARALAHALDSLVRVSRRADRDRRSPTSRRTPGDPGSRRPARRAPASGDETARARSGAPPGTPALPTDRGVGRALLLLDRRGRPTRTRPGEPPPRPLPRPRRPALTGPGGRARFPLNDFKRF
eukprot:TRINITY_DN28_c1_g3_i1.p1 TRINITY_DN28_c1_g3~~TRINITY_DN28_c1_g3_i1.p1  ORF type:complete len:213 (+),score=-72.89 TRINITY_DN28_c1_g3_i1:1380-2018(+)